MVQCIQMWETSYNRKRIYLTNRNRGYPLVGVVSDIFQTYPKSYY